MRGTRYRDWPPHIKASFIADLTLLRQQAPQRTFFEIKHPKKTAQHAAHAFRPSADAEAAYLRQKAALNLSTKAGKAKQAQLKRALMGGKVQ